MRIAARYSHLNGEEFLLVHRRELWDEILEVIASVDAEACRTKRLSQNPSSGSHGGEIKSPSPLMGEGWGEGENTP